MMPSMRLMHTAVAALVLLAGGAGAHTNELPELGDASSAIVSPEAERALGQQALRQIRAQVPTSDDPLLKYFTQVNIRGLAQYADLNETVLYPVLVDSPEINAFAVPGGIIGINLGLYLYAEDVHEYSSVVAHELAHLSQRHFARQVEKMQGMSLSVLAGVLASVAIIAAGGDADAAMATMQGSQALAQDSMLRYSRTREQEADRIGLNILVEAGYDPRGVSRMFERMQRAFRHTMSQRPPEFLLTHPLTESRISDARDQASRMSKGEYEPSADYQFMRARVRVHYADTPKQAVVAARARAKEGEPGSVRRLAGIYELAVALAGDGEYDEAADTMQVLRGQRPDSILTTASLAEVLIEGGRPQEALDVLDSQLYLNPDNDPLTMLHARALSAKGDHDEASRVLWRHAQKRPQDSDIWYLLAETEVLAGSTVGIYRARAEFFALHGDYNGAVRHLEYASRLVGDDDRLRARLAQRILDLRTEREAAGG
ncbi:MAG: M48 family metallopeptidase [Gammaproteobacteria bacterium]|nr:M48 family metallopeptidase [Gammaproteobacteria bacterium]MYB37776.1 M48 family metallopeptidase [Gammaproteobacteria bacterium]